MLIFTLRGAADGHHSERRRGSPGRFIILIMRRFTVWGAADARLSERRRGSPGQFIILIMRRFIVWGVADARLSERGRGSPVRFIISIIIITLGGALAGHRSDQRRGRGSGRTLQLLLRRLPPPLIIRLIRVIRIRMRILLRIATRQVIPVVIVEAEP